MLKLEFQNYIKKLNLENHYDKKQFYKILKSIIKYKKKENSERNKNRRRNKIWKIQKQRDNALFRESISFRRPITKIENNGIFNFRWDIEGAIRRLSRSEAIGLDSVPGNILKQERRNPLTKKFKSWFEELMHKGFIPSILMWGKLLLISKEESNCPIIKNVRPIIVLSAVIKFFESSIIHNLEEIK